MSKSSNFTGQWHANDVPPLFTYTDLMSVIHAADLEARNTYGLNQRLLQDLRAQYNDSINECQIQERTIEQIIGARLRNERRLISAHKDQWLSSVAINPSATIPVSGVADKRPEDLGKDFLRFFPLRQILHSLNYHDLVTAADPIRPSPRGTQGAKVLATSQNVGTGADAIVRINSAKAPGNPKKSNGKAITNSPTSRAAINYDKLQDAPASNLDFPIGNITLAEFAAFHPNGIRSWDAIDRFCGNGLSQATLSKMINEFRDMTRGPITTNSVYRMFKGSITARHKADPSHVPSWQDWTTGIHHQYRDDNTHRPGNISVIGFRTPADGKNTKSAPPIQIRDLAKGVKRFPSGHDALDLTRAVEYCIANPNEDWMYPNDYERLINKIGAAPPRFEHQDAQAIARHTTHRMSAGIRNTTARKRDARGRMTRVESNWDEEEHDGTDTDSGAESDDEIDFDTLDKTKKRNCFDFLNSEDEAEKIEAPKHKHTNMTVPKPRATETSRTTRSPRPHQRIVPENAESDSSDSDLYVDIDAQKQKSRAKKGKKTKCEPSPQRELRRSARASKFTKPLSFEERSGEESGDESHFETKPRLMIYNYDEHRDSGDESSKVSEVDD